MSEEKTEETGGKVTMGAIRAYIDEKISAATSAVTGGDKTKTDLPKETGGDSPSVQEQVRVALERAKRQEERAKRDTDLDKAITELREKTADKPPVARGKLHKAMGWGE